MITVILGSPAHFAASAQRKTHSREYDYTDSWKPCALRGQRKAKDYNNLFAHSAQNESCRNSLKNALPTYMNVLRSAPRATKHAYTHNLMTLILGSLTQFQARAKRTITRPRAVHSLYISVSRRPRSRQQIRNHRFSKL